MADNTVKIIFIFLIVLTACSTNKVATSTADSFPIPAGTLKLNDSLFFDKTEITNFSYLEYLYWTYRVYGRDSKEYFNALPDTSVWLKLPGKYESMVDYYFRHPAYRDFPVVGISKVQADNFSRWRTDRVMQFILIKNGVIKHISPVKDGIEHVYPANKDSIFTIENYFAGKYYGIKPDPRFMSYYKYDLPDTNSYLSALHFKNAEVTRKQKKWCNEVFVVNCLERKTLRNDTLPYGSDPLQTAFCYLNPINVITHLKGNVSELTNLDGIIFGSSFKDSCDKLSKEKFYFEKSPSVSVGFRNVCRLTKWP